MATSLLCDLSRQPAPRGSQQEERGRAWGHSARPPHTHTCVADGGRTWTQGQHTCQGDEQVADSVQLIQRDEKTSEQPKQMEGQPGRPPPTGVLQSRPGEEPPRRGAARRSLEGQGCRWTRDGEVCPLGDPLSLRLDSNRGK